MHVPQEAEDFAQLLKDVKEAHLGFFVLQTASRINLRHALQATSNGSVCVCVCVCLCVFVCVCV